MEYINVKKILTVDDSKSMLDMIMVTLKTNGFEAIGAFNGQEGLEKAKETQVDLIISDINMPIMDGFEFVKKVRELPEYKFTPILILTTENSQEKKMQGRQAGASGWIVKPFDPNILLTSIDKVM